MTDDGMKTGEGRRLVVFDLGRVLVRICDNWQHACSIAGFEVGGEWPAVGSETRAKIDRVIHDYDCGQIDLQTFARLAGAYRGLSAEQVVAINRAYLLGPFDGAGALIDDLHAAGHETACLSNTNASHWAMLTDGSNALGAVLARLRHRFASHLVRARKPDAGIYEHLERETGARAERIVFFDDLADNVEAARRRGWTAHVVPVGENPIPGIRRVLREAGVLR
jgi:putative hydrolase of the HAD superfamily